MNSLRHTWLLALLLAAAPAHGQPDQPMTLEEAIRLGRENSRSLRIAGARADGAAAKAAEAGAALLPSVTAGGGYRRLSDAGAFEVSLPFAPQPIVIAPSIVTAVSAHVGFQQPLFTGFRLRNASLAASRLADAGAEEYRMEESDVVLNVTTAYWSLFQAGRMERFAAENVTRLASYRDDTRRLVETGLATRNDELKMEVQLANAQLLRIEAENGTRVARMSLNMLIGLPLGTAVVPTSRPSAPGSAAAGNAETADTLVARATISRPDLRAMEYRVRAAEASVAAARGASWPQVFLAGGYLYARPNSRYQPPRDEFKGSWDIGVGVTMDLWNWGATARRSEQAEASLRQSQLAYDQMSDLVAFDVRRALLELDRADEKNDVATLALSQAEENLRMTGDRYRNGLATSSELLDASVTLLQAQTSLSGAEVDLALAHARLERALGGRAATTAGTE